MVLEVEEMDLTNRRLIPLILRGLQVKFCVIGGDKSGGSPPGLPSKHQGLAMKAGK